MNATTLSATVAAGFLCLILPSTAQAQSDDQLTVRLTIDECANIDHGDTERLFDIEIRTNGAELTETDATDTGPVTWAQIGCAEENTLRLEVQDPITDKVVIRELDLGSVEEGTQTRIIALALAELVIVSWSELVVNPDPVVPRAAGGADATASAAAAAAAQSLAISDEERVVHISAIAEALFFVGDHHTTALRGGLGVEFGFGRIWNAHIEIGGAYHLTLDTGLGDVEARSYDLGFFVQRTFGEGTFGGQAGVGLRAGVVTMDGVATTPNAIDDAHTGVWAGPALRGCAYIRLGTRRRGQLGLCANGGWGLVSTVGVVDGADTVRVGGPFFGVSLEGGGGP